MSEDPDWSLAPAPALSATPPARLDCGHPVLAGGLGHGHVRLALAQWGLAPSAGLPGFFARVDSALARAVAGGAQLAVLPEMVVMEAGPSLVLDPAAGEFPAIAALSGRILDGLRDAARRSGLWLLGGSVPIRGADGLLRNTAMLVSPAGLLAVQEKCRLTRTEAPGFAPGAAPRVFDTPFGCLGISIGDDLAFPKHVRAQAEAGAWLILAPVRAGSPHAFNRLRFAATARALENQCYVALATSVGAAPWSATMPAHRGHAAVFGPVDQGFPEDGLLARGAGDMAQWVFCDLDTHALDTVRAHGEGRGFADWPRAPFPACEAAPFA